MLVKILLFVASQMVPLEGVLWNFLQKSLVLPGFFLSRPQNNIASSGVERGETLQTKLTPISLYSG